MDKLKQVFLSLSRTEIRYLKNYLSAFHNKGTNKALEFVELMEAHPEMPYSEIAERLYGDPRSKAFLMLKNRLTEKVLETLSLSINFYNNPAFTEDPAAFASIDLHKQMIYANLLRRRGLEELAREAYEKVVEQATLYAVPEFRLQALLTLRNLSHSFEEQQGRLKVEIDAALEAYRTDIIGSGINEGFQALSRGNASITPELRTVLNDAIEELSARLAMHYSLRAHYYLLNLRLVQLKDRNDIPASREVLQELIHLVADNVSLQSKNRRGTPHYQLAILEIKCFNFKTARQAAAEAMKQFPERKTNYLNAAVVFIFACIFQGDLATAHDVLEKLAWFREQQFRKRYVEIVSYLASCISFLEGSLRQAYDLLGEMSDLNSDKSGWNQFLRIHELIILMDMGHMDLASSRIEAMRKHIQRYKPEPRIAQIHRYLVLLEKHSFQFHAADPEMNALLDELSRDDTWSAMGSEVIRFDVWVRAHKAGEPFYPVLLRSLATISPEDHAGDLTARSAPAQ
ncbi:MAG: hypothetical protein OHK0039_02820 [Bacteroidia bacterium]